MMNMRIIAEISDFVFVEDKLERADAILVPGGSYPELPERAAELWKNGYADLVVPSGKYSIKLGHFAGVKSKREKYDKNYLTECEFYKDILEKNGVSSKSIILENESQCTADNARFSRRVLDEKNIHLQKAIICCKGFHARRCLMFYQFYFPETEFMVAPVVDTPGIDVTRENWYKTEVGLTKVLGELSRLGTQFIPEFGRLKDELTHDLG
ncbi:MAG: YdcF family protein [Lachnospiraceae bacterium]